jgi:hypothetical protein
MMPSRKIFKEASKPHPPSSIEESLLLRKHHPIAVATIPNKKKYSLIIVYFSPLVRVLRKLKNKINRWLLLYQPN